MTSSTWSGMMAAVTTPLLTPWWRNRREAKVREASGSVEPTAILNWHSPEVRALTSELGSAKDGRDLLQRAHGVIAARVRPVYAVDDAQPVSRTLARGRGSCSQRLGVLEAVARASGIATRSRGLLADGRFWYPRFRHLRFAVPDAVLLAWPEFYLDEVWVSASELFGPPRSGERAAEFTNADGETLFDALARGAVDWDGVTSGPGMCSTCDLSATVLRDLGRFDSRDELFTRYGQTLFWPARTVAEPFLSRWAAGSTAPAA
jgi:Transglutaminase-like superfamily